LKPNFESVFFVQVLGDSPISALLTISKVHTTVKPLEIHSQRTLARKNLLGNGPQPRIEIVGTSTKANVLL